MRSRPRFLTALAAGLVLFTAASCSEPPSTSPPPEAAGAARAEGPRAMAPGGRRTAGTTVSLTSGEGPRLTYAEGESGDVDFGRVVEGRKLTHVFHLITGGDAPTVISDLKTTCKCTRAHLFVVGPDGTRREVPVEEPIEPGTEVEVEVNVSSHERIGEWHSRIDVLSNDPARRLRLTTQGSTQPIFTYDPGLVLALGRRVRGEHVEGAVRFSTEFLDPFHVSVREEETADELEVSLVPLGVEPGQPSTAWEVRFAIESLAGTGFQSFPLYVETNVRVPWPKFPAKGRKYAVLFHVNVDVVDPVTIDPARLTLGRLDPTEAASFEARAEAHDGRPWTAAPAAGLELRRGPDGLADALAVEVELADGGDALRLRLVYTPTAEAASFTGGFAGTIDLPLEGRGQDRARLHFKGSFGPAR